MATIKPFVLVLGATGNTGGSIVNGLLASGNFRVAAVVRQSSLTKPATETLRAAGVEIRVGDITDDIGKLKALLEGVDIVISAVVAWMIPAQKDVIRAAKEVGIKRFVPCDFATPGARGVRQVHDSKQEIRDFVQELGVPYTFIDVGWWMQLLLPCKVDSAFPQRFKESSWELPEGLNSRMLLTSLADIGKFVAKIVADPRTLNQAVIVWGEEMTLEQAYEIGERVSGQGQELKSRKRYIQPTEYLKSAAIGKEMLEKDPNDVNAHILVAMGEYRQSMYVLQENTLENAKRLGYLDARELYPDVTPISLEEVAKKFYNPTLSSTSQPSWE